MYENIKVPPPLGVNHGPFCKRIKMIKKKSVYKAGKEYENEKSIFELA